MKADEEKPTIDGISYGIEADARARAMGLPEPTLKTQRHMLAVSWERWRKKGPGVIIITPHSPPDSVLYVPLRILAHSPAPPELLDNMRRQLAEVDPRRAFVLVRFFLDGIFVIRTYAPEPERPAAWQPPTIPMA